MPDEKPLTIDKAARMSGYHPDSLRRMVRAGTLPDRRPPGARKILLYKSDLVREPKPQ